MHGLNIHLSADCVLHIALLGLYIVRDYFQSFLLLGELEESVHEVRFAIWQICQYTVVGTSRWVVNRLEGPFANSGRQGRPIPVVLQACTNNDWDCSCCCDKLHLCTIFIGRCTTEAPRRGVYYI